MWPPIVMETVRLIGHPLPLCLVFAATCGPALAWADEASPALLVVPPVVEQGAGATTQVGLPAGGAIRLRASSGSFDAPVEAGGAWSAQYRPGEPVEPGAVIFHASRERCGGTWVVALRAARALHPLRTKPGASITVVIGDRVAGTTTADDQGRASVSSRILPADTEYEVRALDRLGNENRRRIALPAPTGPPPLLVEACADAVLAGQSVLVEVAATDHTGSAITTTWSAPPEVGVTRVATAGPVSTYRIAVDEERGTGPLRIEIRNGAAVVPLLLPVQGLERPRLAETPPPARTFDDGSARHAGALLSGDTGVGSNLDAQWGTASNVAVAFRPRRLDGRLVPRLALSVDALWGRGLGASSVRALATSLELGVAATVVRAGHWDVDLHIGVGGGYATVAEQGSPGGDGRFLPVTSVALAVRRVVHRGALTARLGWRQTFRGSDASDAEASDNRGIATLTVGGEVDL